VKFTLEPSAHPHLIRSYDDTQLWIGAQRITRSCIVTAERLITDWPPATYSELLPAHLDVIFALAPEVVLIGTGPTHRFAAREVRAAFAQRGVGVEVMQLGAACRTFNVLLQEDRRVAAALFLR
jgi:uncharacterized protein